MSIFVIISSQIVNIRQKKLLNSLTYLNDYLQTNNQQFKSQFQALSLWNDYLRVNRLLISLSTDIEQCASYFSCPITVYFMGFITLQCYLAYIVFFVSNLNLFVNLFFLYCLTLVETCQFILNHSLSKLTQCNGKLEKANEKFYLLFNRKSGFKTKMIPLVVKVVV